MHDDDDEDDAHALAKFQKAVNDTLNAMAAPTSPLQDLLHMPKNESKVQVLKSVIK